MTCLTVHISTFYSNLYMSPVCYSGAIVAVCTIPRIQNSTKNDINTVLHPNKTDSSKTVQNVYLVNIRIAWYCAQCLPTELRANAAAYKSGYTSAQLTSMSVWRLTPRSTKVITKVVIQTASNEQITQNETDRQTDRRTEKSVDGMGDGIIKILCVGAAVTRASPVATT